MALNCKVQTSYSTYQKYKGDKELIHSILLAAVSTSASVSWSPKVGIVMIICNILAIAIGKYSIQQPSVGPAMPSPPMFGGMSLGAVLGVTSLGHILGAGVILGLASSGVL